MMRIGEHLPVVRIFDGETGSTGLGDMRSYRYSISGSRSRKLSQNLLIAQAITNLFIAQASAKFFLAKSLKILHNKNMTHHLEATETQTKEVTELYPEEMADLLQEQAFAELQEAKLVPFTPVEDASKLDQIINATQKKLAMLLTLDVAQGLKADLAGFAQLETEDGKKNIALIDQVNPSLDAIMSIEAKIATAIARYQKVLVDCLKQKRLLSGQMFGTRMAHSAQVSRMKRVRQITLTGNDLLKEFAQTGANPKLEMDPIEPQSKPVIELFPKEEPIEVNFEPLPDTLPFQVSEPSVYKVVEKQEVKNQKTEKDEDKYCATYDE